jgi:RNA recognition motif-containing protein
VSIYVGDLDHSVSDSQLLELFQKRFKSAFNARIVVDPSTKQSKGYGFVKFMEQEERDRALTEMQG